jgi:hypothetical protein
VFGELAGEELERLLHQRQLVGLVHGAGDVEQEDEVAGRARFGVEFLALEGDLDEGMGGVPGAGGGFHVYGEGVFALGRGVGVGEVVDHFLDAHGVGGRQLPGAEEAADVGIGGGIHVDGECRERFIRDALERVALDGGIGFCVCALVRGRGDAGHGTTDVWAAGIANGLLSDDGSRGHAVHPGFRAVEGAVGHGVGSDGFRDGPGIRSAPGCHFHRHLQPGPDGRGDGEGGGRGGGELLDLGREGFHLFGFGHQGVH